MFTMYEIHCARKRKGDRAMIRICLSHCHSATHCFSLKRRRKNKLDAKRDFFILARLSRVFMLPATYINQIN